MVLKGTNGIAPTNGRVMRVDAELEMAALEDCGPITRRALNEMPLPTLAYSFICQIIEANQKIEAENKVRMIRGLALRPYLDPKDPDLDRRMAQALVANNFQLIANDVELGDRALDAAKMGIKPLVPKLSSVTIRERKKTQGRRFRRW